MDISDNKEVAVKEYYPNGNASRVPGTVMVNVHSKLNDYKRGMEKFLQEARIIHHYNNNNILKIYSLFEENDTAYYVMEFL